MHPMKSMAPKLLFWVGLLALYVLHQDFWFWDDPTLVLGVPVGLLYHILYCVAVALFFALFVKSVWPHHLERSEQGPQL